jgi:hypothetical protein
MQRIGNGRTGWILDGGVTERSDDIVCGLHRARGARVSWLSLKIKVDSFLQFGIKSGGIGFLGLGLKTDSPGLMI